MVRNGEAVSSSRKARSAFRTTPFARKRVRKNLDQKLPLVRFAHSRRTALVSLTRMLPHPTTAQHRRSPRLRRSRLTSFAVRVAALHFVRAARRSPFIHQENHNHIRGRTATAPHPLAASQPLTPITFAKVYVSAARRYRRAIGNRFRRESRRTATGGEPLMGRVSTIGRVLFGGVLAFTAIDNLRDIEGMAAYADAKGVPKANRLVPLSSGMLLFGGIATALGRVPRLAGGAIAAFLVGVTPMMHDFWNLDDDQREAEVIQFLKNVALLGGALFFLARGPEEN
jgi:putative oxidoreductase